MTLDAGGTNLAFTAMQGGEQVVDEFSLPTNGSNLDRCLSSIVDGFTAVRSKLEQKPVAISFAFPGPADYPHGIIGDLPNLPAFRGGVALGPMLEEKFGLPVFINNDGDMFAYGESVAGFLPFVNDMLRKAGSEKRYRNLLGLTLGTGFGAGIAINGDMLVGDNANAAGIYLMRNKLFPAANAEDHVSIRGIRRLYALETGTAPGNSPTPKEIYDIATGKKGGDKPAALRAYKLMAEAAGDAISHAIALIDGLVVIGGGLAGASELFLPQLVEEMNSSFTDSEGKRSGRLPAEVYNLEDKSQLSRFLKGSSKEIAVYGSAKRIRYDPEMRIGVGISRMGATKAISVGAYVIALKALDT